MVFKKLVQLVFRRSLTSSSSVLSLNSESSNSLDVAEIDHPSGSSLLDSYFSSRRLMADITSCFARLLNLKLQYERLVFNDPTVLDSEVGEKLTEGLPTAELLTVLGEFIYCVECELGREKKSVHLLKLQNKKLQNDVLQKHNEWIANTMLCEELRVQLVAWLYVLSLEDPNHSALAIVDDGLNGKNLCLDSSFYGNSSSFSTLPWIHLPESKFSLIFRVNDEIRAGNYQRAVRLSKNALELQRIYPANQRHRYASSCVVELPRAMDYFSDLSVRCYLNSAREESSVCADYVVRLLVALGQPRSTRLRDQYSDEDIYIQIKNNLMSPLIQESEWALILESCRKLLQIFWSNNKPIQAVGLWLAVSEARKNLAWADTRPDSWRGYSQIACLLTAGLCLFSGQLSISTLSPEGYLTDQRSILLLELATEWAEGCLATFVNDPVQRMLKSLSVDQKEGPQLNSIFLLWVLMVNCLCHHCTNTGAVNDVLVLTVRVLCMMFAIPATRLDGNAHVAHLLHKAIATELCLPREQKISDSSRRSASSSPCVSGEFDSCLTDIPCVELSRCIESVLHETVVVLKGQQWNRAAATVEYWIRECQVHASASEAKRRRTKQCCSSSSNSEVAVFTQNMRHRVIDIPFIQALVQSAAREEYTTHQKELSQMSQIAVSKRKDYGTDDVCCNFSNSSNDPRISYFFPTYKQLISELFELLNRVVRFKSNGTVSHLAPDSFILRSSKRIYSWWRNTQSTEKLTEIRYLSGPLLNRRDLNMMWEEALFQIQREFIPTARACNLCEN
ncbi:unnamed protein product [Calicophoron daubneyi]|uniref:Uncharacterized protein n=1 Tax=Calicophoron daubneyi TaxID=300641 RepID=A0AAV2THK5_CALDB